LRLWSVHPKHLDARGLVAVWREGLLAQAVLRGRTRGYRRHPQLDRFRRCASPVGAIAEYLRGVRAEAVRRGYRFDGTRIARGRAGARLPVSRGQLAYEWAHLIQKLGRRDRRWLKSLGAVRRPQAHPLFRVVAGGVAVWERTRGGKAATMGHGPRR
jgi:Pyrimidine dimer DNA glycosylase